MGKVIIFSKIDLAYGYQMKTKKRDKAKTALVTVNSSYVFNLMSFGLRDPPAYKITVVPGYSHTVGRAKSYDYIQV
ncbi:uncharacterized protein B0P05DRAFT_523540 [Gilbertella persicaria]|uniref:uncharacterized protein n=1 Tax=Gilbertella persicaria TaxID=101096 RepID=UPI00221EDC57|nr:uncharacterized protein B0P05DRAFT_523540 [Gilbertella persicaria]KAI8094824.1 hypothetical protein B0P05DRAFT_523540 [Gilbertella persicaria]